MLDWHDGVLQGAWSAGGAGGAGYAPRYRAVGNVIYLGGSAQGGANGQDIILLAAPGDPSPPPPPVNSQFFAVATSGGTAQVSVNNSGVVHMEAGFNAWVSLDGIAVWLD